MIVKLTYSLIASLMVVSLPLLAVVEYEIYPLQPADYSPSAIEVTTRALDLSESGFVAGTIENYPSWPTEKAFLYHPALGFKTILGPLPKGDLMATNVNNHGVVAGWINKEEWEVYEGGGASCGFNTGAFIYDSANDFFIDLSETGSKDLAYAAGALGITDNGQVLLSGWNYDQQRERTAVFDIVAGTASFDLPDDAVAMNSKGDVVGNDWFYSGETGVLKLGSLDPYGRYDVYAKVVNDEGVVAGVGFDIQDDEKGFIWEKEIGLKEIQTLGGDEISVKAINRHSQVVGASLTQNLEPHAFIYETSLGTIDLGTFGGKKSSAKDINDFSQVVGYAESPVKAKGKRAFIWDPVNGMRDLNDLIPSRSGWKKLEAALKINNLGYIIGEGIYQGEERAFLLIPKK